MPRLNDDHKRFFESTCRIDRSTEGIEDYERNVMNSIKWVVKTESKMRAVIILTDNPQDFSEVCTSTNITAVKPEDFIPKAVRAQGLSHIEKYPIELIAYVLFFPRNSH